jgi:hypothetical protein
LRSAEWFNWGEVMERDSKNVTPKISKLGFIFGIFCLTLFLLACTKSMKIETFSRNHFFVELGEEFEVKKDQKVGLVRTGFELEIRRFFNQPCPPNVKCVWSGIGIDFEYRYNGQLKRGINLVKAFGYKISIIKSDYESYAVLKIMQDKDQ